MRLPPNGIAVASGLILGVALISIIGIGYLRSDSSFSPDIYPSNQLAIGGGTNVPNAGQPGNISSVQESAFLDNLNPQKAKYVASPTINDLTYSNHLSPVIAYSKNNVYVAWEEIDYGDYSYQIHYAASHDYGVTFSNATNISDTNREAYDPRLIAFNDTVILLWEDNSPGAVDHSYGIDQVFMRYSTDSGRSFSQIYNISNQTLHCYSMDAAYANNRLFVTWQEEQDASSLTSQIMFRELSFQTHAGHPSFHTASDIIAISDADDKSQNPKLLASEDGNNIYVGWISQPPPSIFHVSSPYAPPAPITVIFRSSNDGGLSWNAIHNIGSSIYWTFMLGINDKTVHIVWHDRTPQQYDTLFYRRSVDGGQSFGAPYRLNNAYTADTANLVVKGEIVYLSWGDPGILHKRFVISYNDGETFSNSLRK